MGKEIEKIVVVKFPELANLFEEMGLVPPGTKRVIYASEEDVRGKDVFGVVPIYLARHANSITEVPVLAGNQISRVMSDINLIRQYAKPPKRYKVTETAVKYVNSMDPESFGNR